MRIFKRTASPNVAPDTAIDPGVLANAAAHAGGDAYAPLGTAHATITASGRLMACTR